MKHLIYFLLFSSVVFSQNYNYAIDVPKKGTATVLPSVNNQLEEIEYFKAYVLPVTKKATLQVALDTYGSVRLEKGDYSGVPIVMRSNQKLYGHPSTNNITSITIAAGSTNVYLECLKPAQNSALYINFQAGGLISNCTFKTLKYVEITAVNATLENNTMIDIIGLIKFDCSASGYFRNNRIIKHKAQGVDNMLILKGNRATPSYGNVAMHSNYLGSTKQTTDITNLESMTFIGTDCETYGGLSRDLIYVDNVDKLKLFTTNGNINYPSAFSYSNIDAKELYAINDNGNASNLNKISSRTNFLNFGNNRGISRGIEPITGYFSKSYFEENNREIVPKLNYDGINQISKIASSTVISRLENSILGTQYKSWERPITEPIPDPLGPNWRIEREGKPDSTNYIQNLINTKGVADLPEGVFYISSTLNIPIGVNKGITGKGTGKTVICGLTDDFPLISVTSGEFGDIFLSYLTLQGGNVGLLVSNPPMMMSYQSSKYIVFRDQPKGIFFKNMFGLDNNFFEHLTFVNCIAGIEAEPGNGVIDPHNIAGTTYMDKNVFYRNHFMNCQKGMYLRSTRANNLNFWIDCKFDGGEIAVDMTGETTIFANCDFTNSKGDYTLKSTTFNLISCNFYNNSNKKSTLFSVQNTIEGCNFLDKIPLGSPVEGNPVHNFIFNSTVTGNAVVVPSELAWRPTTGFYVNSRLISNPLFSKLLVYGINNVPTVILDKTPTPYPQFLVTQ